MASISKRTLLAGKATLKDFPGVVFLRLHEIKGTQVGELHCSGTLIDEYTILTAAHCIVWIDYEERVQPLFVESVYAGMEEPNSQDQSKLRKRTHPNLITYLHPKFFWAMLKHYRKALKVEGTYDIAIIKSKIPFQFDNDFKPMKVRFTQPFLSPIDNRRDIFVVSYSHPGLNTINHTSPDDPMNNKVLQSETPMLNSQKICYKCAYNKDIHHNFNIRAPTIYGDSGGALVQMINGQAHLIGIISVISTNHSSYSSTFTHSNFIKSRMGPKLDECGIPDQEDLSFIYPPHNFTQKKLNTLFVWMNVVLDKEASKLFCLAIHITDERLVAPAGCFSPSSRDAYKLAGMFEMQVLNSDTSHLLRLDLVEMGKKRRNGIQLFKMSPSPTKLSYTRPICCDSSIEQVTVGKVPIYAIGYTTEHGQLDVDVVEQKFVAKKMHGQSEYLCTVNNDRRRNLNQSLPTRLYALVTIINQKYQLLGLGSGFYLGEECINSFFHFRHTDFA